MKSFRELNIGDSIYYFQFDHTLNKVVIIEIFNTSIDTRFYYDTPYGKFYVCVISDYLDSTCSCGLYSCIEAVLNMINNDNDEIF